MRCLRLLFLVLFGLWQCSVATPGAEFRLSNGDIVRGEAVSFNDDGLVVRLDIGGHSPRISWSKLTQETLQRLAANPEAAGFVEPFIEIPPAPKDKEEEKVIQLKPVPRVEQVENPNFFASFVTPAGLMILLVLLAANVYAAYEIAHYRRRSPGLVCALSILFPIVAPALVLAMPSAEPADIEAPELTEPAAAQALGKATTGPLAHTPMATGLSIAQGEKVDTAAGGGAPQIYKRGEFTFNRRFIETKFPSFFRLVQSDADKDLILIVRAGKDEHTVKRISRISSTDVHLQLTRGGEVSVPFPEISEIQVRHKDVKAK